MILALITFLGLAIRLVQLHTLPAEPWGDVITHFHLAQSIARGDFFVGYRFGGDGAMFSYLLGAFSFFSLLNFDLMKLTTVVIGCLLVPLVYVFAAELFERKEVGYIAAFLTAASFWAISFSRQAKPYILVPLFVTAALVCALKKRYSLAGLMLGLGMYTQAAFWGMFAVGFLLHPLVIAIGIIVALPLFYDMVTHANIYFQGGSYIGEKMHISSVNIMDVISKISINFGKNLQSFFIEGDGGFRQNIPHQGQLDILSGIFFLIGFILIVYLTIKKGEKKYLFYLIIPFFVIQIPSVLDINNPLSTPSMGRMIGIVPIVFAIAAYAVATVTDKIKQIHLRSGILMIVLLSILLINLYHYFIVYPQTLPNQNVSFSQEITAAVKDKPSAQLIMFGCCWGEWGQPETDSLTVINNNKLAISYITDVPDSCIQLETQFDHQKKTVFIVAPTKDKVTKLTACYPQGKLKQINKGRIPIATMISIN